MNILKKLKKIKVSKLKKIDTYLYEVTINIIYHKEFKKLFPDAKLVKKKGIYFLIKEKLLKKLTIISLLIGLIFYLFLLSLIYRVDIKGNNQRINENILMVLNENKIYKYQKIPSLFSYPYFIPLLLKLKLSCIQLIISALLLKQFIVTASLDYLALFKNHYGIRISYCRKSVSDNKYCSSLHYCVHAILNKPLSSRINRACRLI